MIKIKFKKMQLMEDERTVKIIGEYKNEEMEIELSVLQVAKVFRCDKEVLKEQEKCGWGSGELEDKCEEIREIIKKFPNVKIGKNEINVRYTSVVNKSFDRDSEDMKNQVIRVFGEDLSGWENEGIMIRFPVELYKQDLQGKEFDFILKQDSIELRIK